MHAHAFGSCCALIICGRCALDSFLLAAPAAANDSATALRTLHTQQAARSQLARATAQTAASMQSMAAAQRARSSRKRRRRASRATTQRSLDAKAADEQLNPEPGIRRSVRAPTEPARWSTGAPPTAPPWPPSAADRVARWQAAALHAVQAAAAAQQQTATSAKERAAKHAAAAAAAAANAHAEMWDAARQEGSRAAERMLAAAQRAQGADEGGEEGEEVEDEEGERQRSDAHVAAGKRREGAPPIGVVESAGC